MTKYSSKAMTNILEHTDSLEFINNIDPLLEYECINLMTNSAINVFNNYQKTISRYNFIELNPTVALPYHKLPKELVQNYTNVICTGSFSHHTISVYLRNLYKKSVCITIENKEDLQNIIDNPNSFIKYRRDICITCIAMSIQTVIHELHHSNQYISPRDSVYEIEDPVYALTNSFCINNASELSMVALYGYNTGIDIRILKDTLLAYANYSYGMYLKTRNTFVYGPDRYSPITNWYTRAVDTIIELDFLLNANIKDHNKKMSKIKQKPRPILVKIYNNNLLFKNNEAIYGELLDEFNNVDLELLEKIIKIIIKVSASDSYFGTYDLKITKDEICVYIDMTNVEIEPVIMH